MRTVVSDSIEYAVQPQDAHQDRELLAKGFPGGVFWIKHGVPYVVFPDWDYAERWGAGPVREVHPYWPVLGGARISDTEFRAKVREIRGI